MNGCETNQSQSLKEIDGKAPFSSYLTKEAAPYNLQIKEVLAHVKEGDLISASRIINTTLQDYPETPQLHLLNGLIYEYMGDRGYEDKKELAAVAYQNALNLEPTNEYAIVAMGRLKLKQKQYAVAQDILARALLINADNPAVLHDLAVASYYARDLEVARASIQKALALQKKPLFYRSAALIFAATGEKTISNNYFKMLVQEVGEGDPDIPYLRKRLQKWHQAVAHVENNPTQPLSVSAQPSAPGASLKSKEQKRTLRSDPNYPVIILDCFILRVSEVSETSKGHNVLDFFQNGIGLTLTPGGITYSNSKEVTLNTQNSPVSVTKSVKNRTFTQGLTWGTINYNLNIANAKDSRVEVLGRPTLSAYVNKKATFNSGTTIKGGIQGTVGGSMGEIPSGILLEVMPTQLSPEEVTLDISLEGSLLENNNETKSLSDQTFRLSKTKITTTLKLSFGETGMLGGVYERIDTYGKSGFPILQDIPGIEYLFSHEQTSSSRRSVLFLVTPRRVDYVDRHLAKRFSVKQQRESQPSVQELIAKEGTLWGADAPPTLGVILESLAGLYYEYRTGDLLPTFWGNKPDLEMQINQIAAFLYY